MDRVICFMEAEGYADSKQIVRVVKRRFPELETVSLSKIQRQS